MVDKELLEALGQMMDQRFAEQERKTDQRFTAQENKLDQMMDEKLAQQKTEILTETNREMKTQLDAAEQRMTQNTVSLLGSTEQRVMQNTVSLLDAAEQRITKSIVALMDAEFIPKFNLLAEGQSLIIERLDRVEDRLESLETKVGAHEIKLRVVE